MKFRICIVCGERYFGDSIYCSERCREENLRIKKHAQEILSRTPRKKNIKSELARINEEARATGMTYGHYVAFCEQNIASKKRRGSREK